MLTFLKTKYIIILIIIVAILVGGYLIFFREKGPVYEFVNVKKGDIAQIVSITGQVRPAENIDLAFDKSGKVIELNVKIGDKAKTDQILAVLDNKDIKAQLSQAQAKTESAKALLGQYEAVLQTQQAKLDELKIGIRAEEIAVYEIKVDNAQKSLADAQSNLLNVKNKAEADLRSDYDSALNATVESITVSINALFTLTDIQYAHFSGTDYNSNHLADVKADAVLMLLGTQNGGRYTKDALNQLNGGAKFTVETAQTDATYENIDKALNETASALQKIKTALNAVPVTSDLTSTELTNLSTEKTSVNTEISAIATKQQAIEVQKATNEKDIAAAEASVNTTQNNLASAEADLTLKKAGATPEQIAAQEAQVRQAEANIISQQALIKQAQASALQSQADLEKTILKAPTDGTITNIEKEKGEIAQANTTIISMINSGNFQIEANVSETEIAKVKLDNDVEITLDALGPDEKFSGKIIKINPAETVVSGVIYYKITSIFGVEDERIKSGMTANLDIQTDRKEGVLYLPYYVIKEKNGEKYVQILENNKAQERIIKTGLEGEMMVEIVSGLGEGEKVAIEK